MQRNIISKAIATAVGAVARLAHDRWPPHRQRPTPPNRHRGKHTHLGRDRLRKHFIRVPVWLVQPGIEHYHSAERRRAEALGLKPHQTLETLLES
jgi:hypothetical protein